MTNLLTKAAIAFVPFTEGPLCAEMARTPQGRTPTTPFNQRFFEGGNLIHSITISKNMTFLGATALITGGILLAGILAFPPALLALLSIALVVFGLIALFYGTTRTFHLISEFEQLHTTVRAN